MLSCIFSLYPNIDTLFMLHRRFAHIAHKQNGPGLQQVKDPLSMNALDLTMQFILRARVIALYRRILRFLKCRCIFASS